MIKFILNNKDVSTSLAPGFLLLDFIRYQQHLMGTKIGCREGDCGACTVLVGEIKNDELVYRSVTSCLTPLRNVHGTHVVTIEGVNLDDLNPVQQAICDESATQCGFCTPGFVMSLTGFCLDKKKPSLPHAIAAIDGNICRCTGYKSLERAAERLNELMHKRKHDDPVTFVVEHKILPPYFAGIEKRLKTLSLAVNGANNGAAPGYFVGGGTDLYVQKPEELKESPLAHLMKKPPILTWQEGYECRIDGSATVTDLLESEIIQKAFPRFNDFMRLVSSTPIRNIATIAGNFINASPIGDLTIFFLALDARVVLTEGERSRPVPLRSLYKGYKTLDKQPGEYVSSFSFTLPAKNSLFNFEKVSKRKHLDIASVNTALAITVENDIIRHAALSAGGVGPVPAYLNHTSGFLTDKQLNETLIHEAIKIAQTEISPISDSRGSMEYKRLLLSQLIKTHFITLFPALATDKMITY